MEPLTGFIAALPHDARARVLAHMHDAASASLDAPEVASRFVLEYHLLRMAQYRSEAVSPRWPEVEPDLMARACELVALGAHA